MNKNGFFKLDIRSDGTYVKIISPSSGGERVSAKELYEYLSKYRLTEMDVRALEALIAQGDGEGRVGKALEHPVNELCDVEVTLDKMRAIIRFYPPSNGGTLMTEDEVIASLKLAKVKEGIKNEVIREFFTDRQYCMSYQVAVGTMPYRGKDGVIKYCFNTKKDFKPKYNEDGSVDFKELNTISYVAVGDKVAELEPPVPGKDGVNVFGEKMVASAVKPARFDFGSGMHVSESGESLIADVAGAVDLLGARVSLSEVLDIQNDVDASTGNIHFDGNVEIPGTVRTGYSVEVGGDCIIGGVVEGAVITAGGNIIVRRGIQGGGNAILRAGGNIYCKFIEGADVDSGESIETDCIMHSKVVAKREIKVLGAKGFITGGEIHCDRYIMCNTIGSELGANTRVSVGVANELKARIAEAKAQLDEHKALMDEAVPIVAQLQSLLQKGSTIPSIQMPKFTQAAASLKIHKEGFERIKPEYDRLVRQLQNSSFCKITVNGEVYPGTTVEIDGLINHIEDVKKAVYFVKEKGELYCFGL